MNGAKLFIIVQISVSRLDKHHLPPIPLFRRPDGEVYPIASLTIALNQEFVIGKDNPVRYRKRIHKL